MKRFNPFHAVAALASLLLAGHAMAADDSARFDLACKPVNQEITGTNTTGGAIKPFDLDDPFYTFTISVDIENLKYCVLTRCGDELYDFAKVSGDEYATSDQAADAPDDDGDIYTTYQAVNPKTNSMHMRITYLDSDALDTVGTSTLSWACTRAPFTHGGLG